MSDDDSRMAQRLLVDLVGGSGACDLSHEPITETQSAQVGNMSHRRALRTTILLEQALLGGRSFFAAVFNVQAIEFEIGDDVLDNSSIDVLTAAMLSAMDRNNISTRAQKALSSVIERNFDVAARPSWQPRDFNAVEKNLSVFVMMNSQGEPPVFE